MERMTGIEPATSTLATLSSPLLRMVIVPLTWPYLYSDVKSCQQVMGSNWVQNDGGTNGN